jgi:hypothetical protein
LLRSTRIPAEPCAALRFARTCYDHVAGKLGVAIADSMVAKRYLVFSEDRGEMTKAGVRFLTQFGAELDSQAGRWRIFCRACLDRSERRYHIAGFVGAEILRRRLDLDWLVRRRNTRAIKLTPAGRRGLHGTFGIDLDILGHV